MGRCMINPQKIDSGVGLGVGAVGLAQVLAIQEGALDDILFPRYRGHSSTFWSDLQSLHDIEANWNKHGLTEQGFASVRKMKEKYL